MTKSNFYYFKESGERAWCVWTLKEQDGKAKKCVEFAINYVCAHGRQHVE